MPKIKVDHPVKNDEDYCGINFCPNCGKHEVCHPFKQEFADQGLYIYSECKCCDHGWISVYKFLGHQNI